MPPPSTLAKRYYEDDDASVLPRSIASFEAFDNAMALDIAMGGSTNTILHLLAAAQEAGLKYDLDDIDAKSRQVPCLAKVAPNVAGNKTFYMEDVHRAGGIPALLGELNRGGLLHTNVKSVHSEGLTDWLDDWDIRGGKATETASGPVDRGPRRPALLHRVLAVGRVDVPGHRRRRRLPARR